MSPRNKNPQVAQIRLEGCLLGKVQNFQQLFPRLLMMKCSELVTYSRYTAAKWHFFVLFFSPIFANLFLNRRVFPRPDPGRCWENLGWPRIKRLLPLEAKIRPIRDQFAARNGPNGEAKCSIGAKALGGRLFFPRCVCDSGAETQCKWVAGCFRAVLYCAGPIMGAPLRFDEIGSILLGRKQSPRVRRCQNL